MRTKLPFLLKRPVAIVGMGISGKSVLDLLLASGVSRDEILTFDKKNSADFNSESDLLEKLPKSLVVSPGVPLESPWIKNFVSGGGQLTSELEIAFSFLTTEKVIGVTGSVGKSTCVSILQAGLAEFSPGAFVGGNLGTPLAQYARELLQGRPKAEWVVLELSSYQLENFSNLRANACVVTSLTRNHLERYPDTETYYKTKLSLLPKTAGPIILNKNGGDLPRLHEVSSGAGVWICADDLRKRGFSFQRAHLIGEHNYDNIALAQELALQLKWPEAATAGFLKFSGLPHRLENLEDINGVLFVNDSKATTISSVLQACQSLKNVRTGKIYLLLGGRDKNLPWHELQSLSESRKEIVPVFFGECRSLAKKGWGHPGPSFEKLGPAIDWVFTQIRNQDVVLLSPGGTSLDEFTSFEKRGEFFKSRILEHSRSQGPQE